jgi:RNA polymerase sigma-70 factor (ECF subfamily)
VLLRDDCPSRARPVEQQLAEQEELQRALAALDALPPRQREVLYLNACEDLSLREIAEILGISADAAKSSLALARKKLRHDLGATTTELPQTGECTP